MGRSDNGGPAVCKTVALMHVGSSPTLPTKYISIMDTSASNPNKLRNDAIFERWKTESNISAEICSNGVTNSQELKTRFKDRIKAFLLVEQQHKCSICGQVDIWNGLPFVLILDHIDGNPYNHSRSNLRLICPICDTQLPTHGAKNRGNGRHSERLRYHRQKQQIHGSVV